MEITYLGHSAFRLRGKEVTVLTDPYPQGAGPGMGKVQADIVTLSSADPDHSYVDGVSGEPRQVRGPGEYEVADVLIAGVATATEPNTGPTNTAYVLRFDDIAVCHLGSVHSKLTPQQIEEIGNVDVLLVPVGGNGALAPAQAAEVVHQLEPALVVPMEYKDGGASSDKEPLQQFCREMGTKEVAPETKLNVTKNTLPQEVRVVVLENRRA